jgi:hypothetical protein
MPKTIAWDAIILTIQTPPNFFKALFKVLFFVILEVDHK